MARRFLSDKEIGYAGRKIVTHDRQGTILESCYTEPDGHGGRLIDVYVEWDGEDRTIKGLMHNLTTSCLEACLVVEPTDDSDSIT